MGWSYLEWKIWVDSHHLHRKLLIWIYFSLLCEQSLTSPSASRFPSAAAHNRLRKSQRTCRWSILAWCRQAPAHVACCSTNPTQAWCNLRRIFALFSIVFIFSENLSFTFCWVSVLRKLGIGRLDYSFKRPWLKFIFQPIAPFFSATWIITTTGFFVAIFFW